MEMHSGNLLFSTHHFRLGRKQSNLWKCVKSDSFCSCTSSVDARNTLFNSDHIVLSKSCGRVSANCHQCHGEWFMDSGASQILKLIRFYHLINDWDRMRW